MVQSRLLSGNNAVYHAFYNRKESEELPGARKRNLISAQQVHGVKIDVVKNVKGNFFSGCDGLITGLNLCLSVRTADCLPLLFFDPTKKIIAAVHAGWRGLLGGIISITVRELGVVGCSPENLIAVIGPHIDVCCYEVDKSRVEKFSLKYKFKNIYEMRSGRWYLNLSGIALGELRKNGLSDKNLDTINTCTFCDMEYSSYRRDKSNSGRQLSIICLK